MESNGRKNFPIKDIQSIIYMGYKSLKASAYLLCRFENGEMSNVKKWLKAHVGGIQTLDKKISDHALNIAFTKDGLMKLGLNDEELETFSLAFYDGMSKRQRILGDFGQNDPDNWVWGNNAKGQSIDMILLVFARNEASLEERIKDLNIESSSIYVSVRIDSALTDREHFGFKDGITDVTTEGFLNHYFARYSHISEEDKLKYMKTHHEDILKDGEILLGYENEYGEIPSGPAVKFQSKYLSANKGFTKDKFPGDLGLNGTYLVFRQLEQDVHAFWKFVDQKAKEMGLPSYDAQYIASKMMGRFPDGKSLIGEGEVINGFYKEDPHGLKCPFASHVRRANPRDTFLKDNPEKSREAVKRHKIIRRGRLYGNMISGAEQISDFIKDALTSDSDIKRGLNFLCFNADISQQFEFIQQNWLNNPKFQGLFNDPDPIASNQPMEGRSYTIPDSPFRKRIEMEKNFVTVVGGSYFFMPGVEVLKHLIQLDDRAVADEINRDIYDTLKY